VEHPPGAEYPRVNVFWRRLPARPLCAKPLTDKWLCVHTGADSYASNSRTRGDLHRILRNQSIRSVTGLQHLAGSSARHPSARTIRPLAADNTTTCPWRFANPCLSFDSRDGCNYCKSSAALHLAESRRPRIAGSLPSPSREKRRAVVFNRNIKRNNDFGKLPQNEALSPHSPLVGESEPKTRISSRSIYPP
jgi:hypothetical protein